METVKIAPKLIYPGMRILSVWLTCGLPVLAVFFSNMSIVRLHVFWSKAALAVVCFSFSIIILARIIRDSTDNKNYKRLYSLSLGVMLAFGTALMIEIITTFYSTTSAQVSTHFSIVDAQAISAAVKARS